MRNHLPQPDPGYAIATNLNHGDLNRYPLIAFPFVPVPIWLAVARGLGPLQQLSKRIANKDPNDLTPLGINTRYAELVPLSSAIDNLSNRPRAKIDREHAFVRDAAHELRTPLAPISAEAHVMTMAGQPDERLAARQRLNQAIARASHLVQSNAIAYIQASGRVVVAISQTSACLRIFVADDGPGIAESQRNLVFERFYRGANRDTPRSGLGLAIVSQGAPRPGGKVALGSGLDGKGCEFSLEVPGDEQA